MKVHPLKKLKLQICLYAESAMIITLIITQSHFKGSKKLFVFFKCDPTGNVALQFSFHALNMYVA